MQFLITGNLGYVGPCVVRHLRSRFPHARLVGFDSGYFAHCVTQRHEHPERALDVQHFGDIRAFPESLLDGVDAVVNLAAISNDPMGNQFGAVTAEINHLAGVRFAAAARRRGVNHFVFASSCSVYGFAADGARNEDSPVDPLTAYARSKVATETDLNDLASDGFAVTNLRFATACGWSPRLRLDLVLNDFVACALASQRISILSDGTPWRPLIHVDDMARAIGWAVRRDTAQAGPALTVNVGADAWNHQVRDLAQAVQRLVPGVEVAINPDAQPDRRSYKVDFTRFRSLAPEAQPQATLASTIEGLVQGLRGIDFADPDFRRGQMIRLETLRKHLAEGRLNAELRWNP